VDAKLREACCIYCDSGDEAKKDVKYCAHVNWCLSFSDHSKRTWCNEKN
jgi:hypothetical protein